MLHLEEDWLLGHPKLVQLNSYVTGHQPQLLSTLQIYLDLTEVKLWYYVGINYSEQLKMAFITARQNEEGIQKCILAVPASSALSMERFSEFFSALSDYVPGNHGDGDSPQLCLAVVDSDSTVIYYLISQGIQTSNNEDVIKKLMR